MFLAGPAVVEEFVGGLDPDEGVAAFGPAFDEHAYGGDQGFDAANASGVSLSTSLGSGSGPHFVIVSAPAGRESISEQDSE